MGLIIAESGNGEKGWANDALIAAMRNSMPAMLDELDAARARIKELEDAGWECLRLGSHDPMYDVLQCDHGIYARYECGECSRDGENATK